MMPSYQINFIFCHSSVIAKLLNNFFRRLDFVWFKIYFLTKRIVVDLVKVNIYRERSGRDDVFRYTSDKGYSDPESLDNWIEPDEGKLINFYLYNNRR